MEEKQIENIATAHYNVNVMAHLHSLRILAQCNWLSWEGYQLDSGFFKGEIIPAGQRSYIYTNRYPHPRLLVGACCQAVRDSRITIHQEQFNLNRVLYVPVRDIASSEWFGGMWEMETDGSLIMSKGIWPGLWPGAWLLEKNEQLRIETAWNGKERSDELRFCYLMLLK